jgi:hypothetical protein
MDPEFPLAAMPVLKEANPVMPFDESAVYNCNDPVEDTPAPLPIDTLPPVANE